jgi:adenylate cyclase
MLDNVFNLMDGPLWSRFKLALAASLLLSLLGLALFLPRTNLILEGSLFDLMSHLRPPAAEGRDDGIVLIAIDDATIHNPRQSSPQTFSPPVWAAILDALVLSGARAVAVHQNLPVMDASQFSSEEEARWFRSVQTAKKAGIPVIYGFRYLSDRALTPSAKYLEIMGRDSMGFLNLMRDRDNKVRRQVLDWPPRDGPGDPVSFALRIALTQRPDLEGLAGDDGYIDFSSDNIPRFSFADIHQSAVNGDVAYFKRLFADKIVFIGDTSSLNMDAYPTPDSLFASSQTGWRLMPAVEIQARSVRTLLSGRMLEVPGRPLVWLLYFGLVFLSLSPILAGSGAESRVLFWVPPLLALAYPVFCVLAFRRDVYVPVVPGMASLLLASIFFWLLRSRENRKIQHTSNQALSLYLNRDLAGRIIHNPETLERRGELRNVTVLFADLVGFTTISETMETTALVDMLNRYYDTMNTAIELHGGFVDKFVGDAIMAVWGAPSGRPDHASAACLSAVMQKRLMDELNRELTAAGRPFLQALMGLNTGQVIAGNIGAKERINYTVMGDAVNLASRLVSANKIFMTTIIASEATYNKAKDKIAFRALDRIKVKGRKGSLAVYEVLAARADLDPAMSQCVNFYERALKHYFDRDFSGALARLEAALKCRPDDSPSLIFAQRCMDFISRPPGGDWDGVTALDVK